MHITSINMTDTGRRNRVSSRKGQAALLLAGALAVYADRPEPARATDATWAVDAGGTWSTGNNWSSNPSTPGGAASSVGLTFDITGNKAVTIDASAGLVSVGTLNIGDANAGNTYTLSNAVGGGLVFDNTGSAASLNEISTSKGDTISAAIGLNDSLNIANASSNTLTLSGTISASASGLKTITNQGAGAGQVTLSNIISDGSGSIAVVQNSSTSQLNISGNNTFSGGISVLAGTAALSANGAAAGTGVIKVGDTTGSANATLTLTSAVKYNNSIVVQSGNSGTATLTFGGSGTTLATGTTTLSGHGLTVNLNSGANYTQKIVETSTSGLVINVNSSTPVFGNSGSTYSGGTTLSGAGLMSFAASTSVFGSGLLTINMSSGAAGFNQQSSSASITGISGVVLNSDATFNGGAINIGLTFSAPVNLGSTGTAVTRVFTVGSFLQLNGIISDGTNGTTKGITKAGGGTLILAGANTYSGATTVNAGVLQLSGSNDRLPTTTVLAINAGATSGTVGGQFDLNSKTQKVAGLAGGTGSGSWGMVVNSTTTNTTLTVESTNDYTYNGILGAVNTGKISLVKNGTGKQTLTASSNYTGGTTINAGTLAISGTATNVATTTATGTATINGVNITGLASTSGLVVGQTVSDGAVNIQAGSYIVAITGSTSIQISKIAAHSGSTSLTFGSYVGDGLGTGNVVVNNGATLELDANITIADTASLTLNSGSTLNLAFNSGNELVNQLVINGALFNTPMVFNSANNYNGFSSYFTSAGGGLQVVPEPGGLAIALAGSGVLAHRRRRA